MGVPGLGPRQGAALQTARLPLRGCARPSGWSHPGLGCLGLGRRLPSSLFQKVPVTGAALASRDPQGTQAPGSVGGLRQTPCLTTWRVPGHPWCGIYTPWARPERSCPHPLLWRWNCSHPHFPGKATEAHAIVKGRVPQRCRTPTLHPPVSGRCPGSHSNSQRGVGASAPRSQASACSLCVPALGEQRRGVGHTAEQQDHDGTGPSRPAKRQGSSRPADRGCEGLGGAGQPTPIGGPLNSLIWLQRERLVPGPPPTGSLPWLLQAGLHSDQRAAAEGPKGHSRVMEE